MTGPDLLIAIGLGLTTISGGALALVLWWHLKSKSK